MLFGRKREIERLRAALQPGATIALVGAAGVGKTSIAIQLVEELGGVIADCRACSDEELDQRLDGAGFAPDAPLLVLDDWTIAMDLGRVRKRYAGPILLTSLDAPAGATPLPVPPLPTTGDDASASHALFAHEAERSLLGAMERCPHDEVARLVEMVGGNPLGIVLAAQHAAAMGAAEVIRLIERGVELRDDGRPARQRSLAVALDTSWRALAPREQLLMYAASRFNRPISTAALADVTGLDVAATLGLIGGLARRGALRPGPYPHPPSMWREVALTRFATDEVERASEIDDAVFQRALDMAREDADRYEPRAIDDAPSYWEAALERFEGRPRADVGTIVRAALNWGKRFAVSRFAPDYLEAATVYSELWEAHITRARMLRQDYGRNKVALERAQAVATEPNEQAHTHFEMALNELQMSELELVYDHLRRARELDDLLQAGLLEAELLLAHGRREEAAARIQPLLGRRAPQIELEVALRTYEIWAADPADRLALAQELVRMSAQREPFSQWVSKGTLADVLDWDWGEVEQSRALREEVRVLAREGGNPHVIASADAEAALGRFIVDPIAAEHEIQQIDVEPLFTETRKRLAVAHAMLALISGKPELAAHEMSSHIRQILSVPSLHEEVAVVDAGIALLGDQAPPPETPVTKLMHTARAARGGSARDQLEAYEQFMELKAMRGWAPRLALHWIRAHGPALTARLERVGEVDADVAFLADFSALRAQQRWHYVARTSATLLRVLASGEPASFETLQQAAWPDELVDWEALVNRVNVRISQLRGMGLKRFLQKTADGFVLDCSIFVEPTTVDDA